MIALNETIPGSLMRSMLLLIPGLYLLDIIYGAIYLAGIDVPVTPGQIVRGGLLARNVFSFGIN